VAADLCGGDAGADAAATGVWRACKRGRRARRVTAQIQARLGLDLGFFFLFVFLFDLPRRASNRLGKGPIYRDLSSEAVAKTATVNSFYPPWLTFL